MFSDAPIISENLVHNCTEKCNWYRIPLVICAALNNVRFKKNREVRYKPDVISHSVTLDLKMREGPNWGDALQTGGACITARIQYATAGSWARILDFKYPK